MPIPKPRNDESEREFISRCMSDPAMVREYENDVRAGVCYTSWRAREKDAKATEVQTVVFSRSRSPSDVNGGEGWTAAAAGAWLRDHDMKAPEPEQTDDSLRYRQFSPDRCERDSYRSLTEGMPPGVIMVACQTGKAAGPIQFWKGNGMRYIGTPFEIKELDERGTFEGLAAVYGNVDLGGDVVEPGAFKEFVTTKDGHVRILDGHNTRMPIGKGRVTDTHLGLAIKGRLNMEVNRAREVHALMRDQIIDGLSIGYDVLENGSELRPDGVRRLKALKLWEVSTTAFPMNQSALVSSVKSIERVRDVRELEEALRELTPLSKAQAVRFAGEIWKTIAGRRESGGGSAATTDALASALASNFLRR